MKAPVIKSTKNYDQFKRFDSNREVNKGHFKKLVDSVKAKNLLHLFPIVVNVDFEIIDGQHRLSVARELGVPIYFLIDDEVTKVDIALVNNNRKQWSVRDYINFHDKEGLKPYKSLNYLLANYPRLTVMAAVKMMKPNTKKYWDTGAARGVGGGNDSMKVKTGVIVDDHFAEAKMICEIAQSIYKQVNYIFRADLMLDLKKLVIENKLKKEWSISLLKGKAHKFPKNSNYYDLTASRLLEDILTP